MPKVVRMSAPEEGAPVRSSPGTWTNREAYLLATVCLLVGMVLGYLFHGSSSPAPGTVPIQGQTAPVSAPPSAAPNAPVTAQALQPIAAPLLTALKANPRDVDTLVKLANLYFDHQVYPEAIDFYARALEIKPNDVNVRTDLGTAYWYSGFADKAIAEYEKSLKVEPTHANTLFNMGVVKLEGMNDPTGAIAAFEKLLKTNPQHPNRQRAQEMLERAKGMKK